MCQYCSFVFIFMFVKKAVVGSGSEGAPKYAGEDVTYGYFWAITPCHMEHWWCSHDNRGLAYKRHCTAPIGVLLVLHIVDCSLWVLMHAQIDAMTRPHSLSLLSSSVVYWVVITVSVWDASTPLHTSETSQECCSTYFRIHLHRTT